MRVNFVDLEIYEILLVFCTWEYPMHQWQLGSFGLAAGLSPMNEPSTGRISFTYLTTTRSFFV